MSLRPPSGPHNSPVTASNQSANKKLHLVEIARSFLMLGLTSFGGPTAHIAYFRRHFVEQKQWLSESQFLQLFAICQFLPGPASSQLGFAIGLQRGGWLGAGIAFILFTLPSALALVIFAYLLPQLNSELASALTHGLKLVAVAVVSDALIQMFRGSCPDWPRRGIAIVSTLALLLSTSLFTGVLAGSLMPLIVIGLAGIFGATVLKNIRFIDGRADQLEFTHSRRLARLLMFIFIILGALSFCDYEQQNLSSVLAGFYQAGSLVFGGGHVVLPLLENQFVHTGAISEEQFLAGYGAAQAIPGPMFSFAAYLAVVSANDHGLWLSVSVALMAIFLPGFLLLAAVLPWWQKITHIKHCMAAIAAINAAVLALLATSLIQTIIASSIHSYVDVLISLISVALLQIYRVSPLWIVGFCSFSQVILLLLIKS